jgi:DNA polymerase III epsilon subunit family exonuclease
LYDVPIKEVEYVVFDFETTGLKPSDGAEAVELGALRVRYPEVLAHFVELVKPSNSIPAGMTAIHGITDEMVASKRSVSEVIPDFLKFIDGTVLVAQNLTFDLAFLAAGCKAAGVEMPDAPAVDIIGLGKKLLPALERYNLEETCYALGVRLINAHRAMGDVMAEVQILFTYVEELTRSNPIINVAGLIAASKGAESGDAELMVQFERAAAVGVPIKAIYTKKGEAPAERNIFVKSVFGKNGKVYVKSHDTDKGEERTFLLDRLTLGDEGGR